MCGDAMAKLNPIADLIRNRSAPCPLHAQAMPAASREQIIIDTDIGYRHQNS
jgi:hypothetical protein